MTMVGLPMVLFNVIGVAEWYDNDTKWADKNGLSGTITEIKLAPFSKTTKLATKNGLSGTTTQIEP